jgi:hypothetical protein
MSVVMIPSYATRCPEPRVHRLVYASLSPENKRCPEPWVHRLVYAVLSPENKGWREAERGRKEGSDEQAIGEIERDHPYVHVDPGHQCLDERNLRPSTVRADDHEPVLDATEDHLDNFPDRGSRYVNSGASDEVLGPPLIIAKDSTVPSIDHKLHTFEVLGLVAVFDTGEVDPQIRS